MLGELRRAYRLARTDSRADTVGAVVIAAVTLGPTVYRLWRARRGGQ